MVNAVYPSYYAHRKRIRTVTLIALLLMIFFGYVLIKYSFGRPEGIALLIPAAILFEICMVIVIIFPLHLLRTKKYSKIVGKNLMVDISEEGVIICDTVENTTIEKHFKWDDFEYIHRQMYTKQPILSRRFYGLQFVVNESAFHSALAKRTKKPNYEQRDEELGYGFFIICDMDYYKTVEEYLGKEIR